MTATNAKAIADQLELTVYGVTVLLEVGLSSDLVKLRGDRYVLTKTGFYLNSDRLTRVNMDFVNDVCYLGMFKLQEAIKEQRPAGLDVFGDCKTIYEQLATLPEKVRQSWFSFDHFYSDDSFPEVLSTVFAKKPRHIIDVGGNTGKWAIQCVKYDPDVRVTIVDLPGQLAVAAENVQQQGLQDRISFYPCDLLSDNPRLPEGDMIWMSQFLDCFSEQEIIAILKLARQSLTERGALYILEPFWDRQRFEAAAFSLHNTSLYFTCLANGNSKMYHSDEFRHCIEEAGLKLNKVIDEIGISNSLFECGL